MKLLTALMIVTCWQISAGNAYSQIKKLNINLKNSSLTEMFEVIEQRSDFTIFYKSDDIANQKSINIDANDEQVNNILDKALSNTGLTYTIQDKVIVILTEERLRQQQQTRTVRGTVTDDNNEPLPGVNHGLPPYLLPQQRTAPGSGRL